MLACGVKTTERSSSCVKCMQYALACDRWVPCRETRGSRSETRTGTTHPAGPSRFMCPAMYLCDAQPCAQHSRDCPASVATGRATCFPLAALGPSSQGFQMWSPTAHIDAATPTAHMDASLASRSDSHTLRVSNGLFPAGASVLVLHHWCRLGATGSAVHRTQDQTCPTICCWHLATASLHTSAELVAPA